MSAKVEKSKDDNSSFDAEAPVNNAVQQRLLDYFSVYVAQIRKFSFI